jgi:DNA-binding NarL/FixJ family response regulator
MKTKRAKRGASGEGVEQPSPPSRRQIFIVDDHPVFREGMVHLVNNEEGLAVCGEAGSAEEALPALQKCHSDLVLVDVSLPGRSGLQLVKDLRALDSRLKLLVVSMHDEALYADRALRAGADGYIMKEEDPDEILRAIRDVLAGRIYVSEAVLASGTKLSNGNAS